MNEEKDYIFCMGLSGDTGDYMIEPMKADRFVSLIRGEAEVEDVNELRYYLKRLSTAGMDPAGLGRKVPVHLDVLPGINPKHLNEAGWGVIFARDADPELVESLKPLLDLRAEQAGSLYRIYQGEDGVHPGETKAQFLGRHQVAGPPVDPEQMPY